LKPVLKITLIPGILAILVSIWAFGRPIWGPQPHDSTKDAERPETAVATSDREWIHPADMQDGQRYLVSIQSLVPCGSLVLCIAEDAKVYKYNEGPPASQYPILPFIREDVVTDSETARTPTSTTAYTYYVYINEELLHDVYFYTRDDRVEDLEGYLPVDLRHLLTLDP
jgi:hypothetical protein